MIAPAHVRATCSIALTEAGTRLFARLSPATVPPFLKTHPRVRIEVTVEDGFVDILAAGAAAYPQAQDCSSLPAAKSRASAIKAWKAAEELRRLE